MLRRLIAAPILAVVFLSIAGPTAAATKPPPSREERRRARMISHLKRLHQTEAWSLARKLFSNDSNRQLRGMSKCPRSESEWPWYLSSHHLQEYMFQVDVISLNLDSDKDEETLIVIQTDPGKINYISFCVLDDAKHGRLPLSSYSDFSRDRPVAFQLTDITNDGGHEIILYSRDGNPGEYSDSVRVIKLNRAGRFDLVWFSRLRDHLVWPAQKTSGNGSRTISRSERLRAKMRLQFNGPKSPSTIVLSGEREHKEVVSYRKGGRQIQQNSVEKFPFVEYWKWDENLFHFVRAPAQE